MVVGNGPGFVGNRMMFPYMYEAQFLVEEGATPEQVDRALTDFGMAMGIFAVDDMAGLDVAVARAAGAGPVQRARRAQAARRRHARTRWAGSARRPASGWYRYGDDRKPIPDPEVLALIEQLADGGRHRAADRSPTTRSSSARSTR